MAPAASSCREPIPLTFIQNWLRLKRLLLPMFRDGLLLAGINGMRALRP
ncbi:Uncharacterised protein [Raoultella planticola]|uniref:Uncharacterized protein n=1 Tax=Raoultella planticola TaxID=575 RepID=A0A485AS91_RAOPL|nr:Uncharacterised protein [Raoultella planticola]